MPTAVAVAMTQGQSNDADLTVMRLPVCGCTASSCTARRRREEEELPVRRWMAESLSRLRRHGGTRKGFSAL